MPDTRHHVDVLVRAANVHYELHSRLLHAAHRCIADGHALAVAWPDWKVDRPDFGLSFRVFGAPIALQAFSDAVEPLAQRQLVYLKPVAATPETAALVTFFRNRSAEKQTAGFIARENRHRQARNKRETSRQPADASVVRPYHLKMQSGSTGQGFSLFVARGTDGSAPAGGASFGLGMPVPHF